MKRILTLALALALSLSLAVPTFAAELKSFSDVPKDHWAYDAIMSMAEQKLIAGTTNPDENGVATFNPNGAMNRSHFIQIVARYLYGAELNAMPAGEKWYSNAYALLLNDGIIKNGDFNNLDVPMSRQEMAYVIANVADKQGKTPTQLVASSNIPDYNTIETKYRDSVIKAYTMRIIAGTDSKGTFNPLGTLNRAQASTVIYRLVNYNGEVKEDKTPSSSIPSGIISAEQWNPENMTKTMAKADELINKYGEEGGNEPYNNKLLFNIWTSDKGTVQMDSYVDNEGLHFKGYESSPDWQGTACLEYMKTLLSETASTNVSTKAVAMLKDVNDREAKLIAEGEKLGYNEKYDVLVDEFDGWMTITSETLWDLGEGCYLSYGPTGYHIYNQWYIDRYDFSSLVKSYDSYTFMKSGQK